MARGRGPEGHSLRHPTATQQTGHPARTPCCAGMLSHEPTETLPTPGPWPQHIWTPASCCWPQSSGKKLSLGTISK